VRFSRRPCSRGHLRQGANPTACEKCVFTSPTRSLASVHDTEPGNVGVAAMLVAVVGCASQPIPDADTHPVASARILAPAYLEDTPGSGVVTVKQDTGLMGSGCYLQLLFDTQPVANLRTSEGIVLHFRRVNTSSPSRWPEAVCVC
jgi:hypothetical protein